MYRNRPTSTAIDAGSIRELIPHAGTMCLLEHVVAFDDTSIRCETRSHLDVNNPLRYKGRLSSLCGIEYAAQAMALHGALKSGAFGTSALKSGATNTGKRCAATAAPMAMRPAAQSTAIDGRRQPCVPAQARHGFLAGVRDAHISRRYMDDQQCPLTVSAALEFDDASRVIYAFTVVAGDTPLISGRAAVVLG